MGLPPHTTMVLVPSMETEWEDRAGGREGRGLPSGRAGRGQGAAGHVSTLDRRSPLLPTPPMMMMPGTGGVNIAAQHQATALRRAAEQRLALCGRCSTGPHSGSAEETLFSRQCFWGPQ